MFEASKILKVLGFEQEEGCRRLEVLTLSVNDHPVSGLWPEPPLRRRGIAIKF